MADEKDMVLLEAILEHAEDLEVLILFKNGAGRKRKFNTSLEELGIEYGGNSMNGLIKCSQCNYLSFSKGNGNPSRYYCKNRTACEEALVGARLISRCDRHSDILKIKTSPKWCPLKREKL